MALNKSTLGLDTTSSDAIRSLFERQLLKRGLIQMVHGVMARKDTLGAMMGDTKIYRRFEALPLPTGPLTEGVNPGSRSKTRTDVKVTIMPYGDVIEDTSFYVHTQPEKVIAENVKLLGQQMGEYIDTLDRDNLANATSIVYRNGSATASVVDIINANTLERALRTLRNNRAMLTTPKIMPSQNQNTFPLGEGYWAVTHEDVIFDLYNVTGFRRPDEYGMPVGVMKGEAGMYKTGLRFLRSPQGFVALGAGAASTTVKNTAGNADVYSIFCMGEEAVVNLRLDKGNGGVITHAFGTSGVYDPLDLRMTTGWYKLYGTGILNALFFVEIQTAASL